MRRILLAAAVPLLLTTVTQLAPAASASPVPACAAVAVPAPPGAKVESVSAERKTDAPAFCQITVTLTHDGGDHVKVVVGLPDAGWTGRLQALGGSAYAAGEFGAPFVQAVKDGYSAVTTDAGVSQNALDTSWALTTGGKVNQTLLTNFATRSAHEEAVVGKAVTNATTSGRSRTRTGPAARPAAARATPRPRTTPTTSTASSRTPRPCSGRSSRSRRSGRRS